MKKMKWFSTVLLAAAGSAAWAQEPAPNPKPDRPPQEKPKPEKPKPEKPVDESKDHAFVSKAAQSNLMEIAIAQLAMTQSSNLDVKMFGQKLVADHGKVNTDLKQLAQKKSITIPEKLSDDEQKMVDGWKKLTGDAFDTRFVGHMVNSHEKSVETYKKASNDSQDADIKAFATNTLPKLEEHLKEAREVKDKVTRQEKPSPAPKPEERPDRP